MSNIYDELAQFIASEVGKKTTENHVKDFEIYQKLLDDKE